MALSKKQIEQIRDELDNCKRPLFFFHDDPDGLSSFLLLYRYIKEGHGLIVKTVPKIDSKFIHKAEEYSADKVFILDIAMVEQEFIDGVNVPVIWIDHHAPLERDRVKYFNPRINDASDNTPVTRICYDVVSQDLWIAMCGCIGDWHIPDFSLEFNKKYPSLAANGKNAGEVYFSTELGKLVRIFSFILKGKTSDAMKCVKILTRIKTPSEILNKESPAGRFIYQKFEAINKNYEVLLKSCLSESPKDNFLVFTYQDKMSFTGDLANEMVHLFPGKVIIIGRIKDEDIRMSIRASNVLLPPLIEKSLVGIEGYGGGHEYACGANVKVADFSRFIENLKKNIG